MNKLELHYCELKLYIYFTFMEYYRHLLKQHSDNKLYKYTAKS